MEVDAGHLRTIRKNDSGLCRVGSSSNQINNDVRNFRDDNLYWWISSVHSRVERSGTGLAFRHMRWAQEIRELFQEIVSIICTKKSLSLSFLLADIFEVVTMIQYVGFLQFQSQGFPDKELEVEEVPPSQD